MTAPSLAPTVAPSPIPPRPPGSDRLRSIDIVRGAVMVLMAIDHVRVFSGLPAGGPTPGIFFTRWVTNFCAPAFVFFAGTGAFFYGRRHGPGLGLSRYLATRGLWLVLLELTLLRWAWTFNFDYAHYLLAGILWAIGWSMVLLSVLVRLRPATVGWIGLAIMAGHNLVDGFTARLVPALQGSPFAWVWQVLYFGGPVRLGGGPVLFILYSIVPWVGVMAAGYGFGLLLTADPARRRRWCLGIGLGATALFLVLRGFHLYGNPAPRGARAGLPPALAFLATNKYPASLQFLLMTLGPTIALLPLLESARGTVARVLDVFGRVPLFYYVLHIPLIHLAAVLVSLFRTGSVAPWLLLNHPVMIPHAPEGYTWSLGLLYLVTALVVTLLYFPCRWFADLKRRRKEPWLSLL